MKKSVKELMSRAVPRKSEKFSDIYIIDSEKKYDGFWGKNGYNNIIVLGRANVQSEELELITEHSDVINIMQTSWSVNIDISSKNGVVHLWADKPLTISAPVNSSCIFYGEEIR